MDFDVAKVGGVEEFERVEEKVDGSERVVYKIGGKAFLVVWPHTMEVRTDGKLGKLLIEKYESVMESRYFGRGGVEMVRSGQLTEEEVVDLVRLSYNLTKEMIELD